MKYILILRSVVYRGKFNMFESNLINSILSERGQWVVISSMEPWEIGQIMGGN